MPDMQQQIDALRDAFSADTRKPFVLKPSFPYGSPEASVNTSPPHAMQYRQQQLPNVSSLKHSNLERQQYADSQPHVSYTSLPISPPISAGSVDTKSDSPLSQSLGPRALQNSMTDVVPIVDTTWNPNRIFEYAAFIPLDRRHS